MTQNEVWVKAGRSPYSAKEKIRMLLWWFVESLLFKPSLHRMSSWRSFLLRTFGAKIGNGCYIDPTAKIWFPWNLEMGNFSALGYETLIYTLDKIIIGDYVTISQRSHIITGSHDFTDPEFPLITKPVVIGSGVFIGAETFVNMGVTIGRMSVIGARSVVTKDMPANMVCVGHPCKPIKERVRKDHA